MQYIIQTFDHGTIYWKPREEQMHYLLRLFTHDANANSAIRRIMLQPRDGSTTYITRPLRF